MTTAHNPLTLSKNDRLTLINIFQGISSQEPFNQESSKDDVPENQSKQTISPTLWLLGTTGCHLCNESEIQLKQLQSVLNVNYQTIDIIDLPEQWMTLFSVHIPVVITLEGQLTYPFSILELQTLVSL